MTKTQILGRYLLLGLVTFAFLGAGGAKLFSADFEVAGFTRWGFPLWFMYGIGICEVAGAMGLWIPRVARCAAFGLIIILFGAIGTHLFNHEGFAAATPAIILILLVTGILYLEKKKVQAPVS